MLIEDQTDECYRCERRRDEHYGPGGGCRCIMVTSDERECECHTFVPEEPPHIAHEWQALTPSERADVERWVHQKGWPL